MEQLKRLVAFGLTGVLGIALVWACFFPPRGMWSGLGMEGSGAVWSGDPWELWQGGTRLRGASIWQRRFTDSDQGFRNLSYGPPYKQEEFDKLAGMGANLVNLSHPGIFAEKAPYLPVQEAIKNLDDLIDKAAKAHLFVVISLRTGPGRTEEGFSTGIFETSNHRVWLDEKARDAWVEMWKTIALRYRDTPNVVGYNLMVEPNSSSVLLKIDDPAEFYPKYANTQYDWNPFAKRLSLAIREVDNRMPILIGGMGWSNLDWLPYVKPTGDTRTAYVVHQWAPYEYTNISRKKGRANYPEGDFNLYWIRNALKGIAEFKKQANAPVMIGEYGVFRWQHGGQNYLRDEMQIFDELGLSSAIWIWESADPDVSQDVFDYRKGIVESNHVDVDPNPMTDALKSYWQKNIISPE